MKRESDNLPTPDATKLKQPRPDTMRLNIGGRRFETTCQTLAGLPYFEPLIEGRFAHAKDENGYVFVDRSGDLFAVLLQFLRCKQRPAEPILAKHGTTLLDECNFYGLESLAQKIRGETCPMDLLLPDRLLRERETTARGDPGAHETMLIDVHAAGASPLDRTSLEVALLLTEVPPPFLKDGFPEFHERLDNFSGGLLSELKDIRGLVFAGGSVIGALTGCPAGDVDIFLRTPLENAEPTLIKIFEAVQRNQARISKRRLMVTRSKNAVTFYRVADQKVARPPVQVRS